MARIPKRVANPLWLLQGKQPIGRIDADVYLFPFASHLYEASQGRAYGGTIRQITMYLSAAYDAAVYYNNATLTTVADEAGDAWIEAGYASQRHEIYDRVVLDARTLASLRKLYCLMDKLVPSMERLVWANFMVSAANRWDSFARDSKVFRQAAETTG